LDLYSEKNDQEIALKKKNKLIQYPATIYTRDGPGTGQPNFFS